MDYGTARTRWRPSVCLEKQPEQRDYAICLPMLEHVGVHSLRLMTNNPRKVKALTAMGITVAERVPLHTGHNPHH